MENKQVSASGGGVSAVVLETRNYVVGAANAPSGLYRDDGQGWRHVGWPNLRGAAVAVDPHSLQIVFLASGNGVLRSLDGGATWRVTTDWRICEVLDVALDPLTPGRVVAASAYGLWQSPDAGETWTPLPPAAAHPNATFTPALVLDARQPGRIVIGTEDGLFESRDDGQTWQGLGPRVAVRALAQSPADPDVWLAGTDGHGVLLSTDGGATWSAHADGATVYAVALDPADADRLAAVGYGAALWVSSDRGATWHRQPLDLAAEALHALAFDPHHAGRLWLGTVGDGVFVTDDLGATCQDAGLPETTVYALAVA